MTYVDAALLDLTEWLCRRFQLLTGRTNVWLAFQLTNLSIVVFFVWAGMNFVIARVPGRIVIAAFSGGLLYLLTRTIFRVPVEEYENSAYRRVAKGLRNPRRVKDALLRVPFLMMSIVLVLFYPPLFITLDLPLGLFVAGYGLVVLTTVVLYLLACDPLPPCQGKVREWTARAGLARIRLRDTSDAADSA
ncbi:MAG: hypothetical protein FJW14_07440 [Acidimicrobiia bacterium]|nr:hypothetical protein [Acidimicrobiia bacterium]